MKFNWHGVKSARTWPFLSLLRLSENARFVELKLCSQSKDASQSYADAVMLIISTFISTKSALFACFFVVSVNARAFFSAVR